jgi:hypothetical protein
MSVSKAL